jgi:SAM-dependent methyltransferase
MLDQALRFFASPAEHAAVSEIIHRRSSNPADVRDAALAGLDLGPARYILDLGCGFGYTTARVLPRVAPDARVIGVDACAENRAPFLELVANHGRQAEFHTLTIGTSLPWADRSFDLILASYSLYFFPGAIGDIARVLRADGLFLTIAHSESSFWALYAVAGVDPATTPLLALLRSFSAENGRAQLRRHFEQVEQVDYRNLLRFGPEHAGELWQFVRFKLPLIFPRGELPPRMPPEYRQRLAASGGAASEFRIEKDDAIFRCRKPRVR